VRGEQVKPSWATKTDPVKHPVRFLGHIWQQQMKIKFGAEIQFTDKEWGQLKHLKQHLGDLTQDVIEWIVDPVNWWHFCQQVRTDWKTTFTPERPHISFLLGRRGVALRVMRSKLSESGSGAEFLRKANERECRPLKSLMLAACAEDAEWLAKIAEAKTMEDLQKVRNQIMDAEQN